MAITYCTDRELKDVYPHVDDFDTKVAVYGWVVVSGDKYAAHNSGLVTQLFVNGESLGDAQGAHTDLNVEGEWFYNSTDDVLYYYTASNPNDKLIEAGEDWVTLKTRYRENASRYLESKIDKNLPREQFKDKDGKYDYVITRTTALLAVSFLIRSHDPTSEVATSFWEEANNEIVNLNEGKSTLAWMTTADGSKGIVRESSVSGSLRIVDTRGRYHGIYDRIGVKISLAGAIGTAKYSVWRGDSDNLGCEKMNNGDTADTADEVINGQYQTLSGGLQLRFAGDTADTATLADKWEVEVSGFYEVVDNASSMRSVRMTRR